jgi:hypothetical protein
LRGVASVGDRIAAAAAATTAAAAAASSARFGGFAGRGRIDLAEVPGRATKAWRAIQFDARDALAVAVRDGHGQRRAAH